MAIPNARTGAARLLAWITAVFLLAATAFYLVSTLCAIANFAWRQPMFDQWRMYETFFGLPFPQNILQLENGHRPIIPNLFRIAEIHWLAANQLVQISIGTACVFIAWCLLARVVWQGSLIRRAASLLLVTLGLLWLENSRNLMHGNESLHIYLLTLAVVCAMLSAYEAYRRQSILWFASATLCCVVAMFCFGPGVASFPALVIVALALRLPLTWSLLPAVTLVACLGIYFMLPGSDGVHHMLTLDPWVGLRTAARWLSSPWVHGWLGFADPPLYSWMSTPPDGVGKVLRSTARALVDATNIGWHELSGWIGFAGMFACTIRCGAALWSKQRPDRLETVMLGIALFSAATAGVIAIGRLDYIAEHPDQTYSDRYLVWTCLFWMSMAVLFLKDLSTSRYRTAAPVAYIGVVLLPLALLSTQSASAISSAIIYRISQANAAAVESGVYDEKDFPSAGVGRESTLREIALLRDKGMAMFSDGAWHRVGTKWTGTLRPLTDVDVQARWLPPVIDPTTEKSAGRVEGWAKHGAKRIEKSGKLAIVDDEGTIAGLAEWSFIVPQAPSLLFSLPRKKGFDGYVHDRDPQKRYRLAALDFIRNEGTILTSISAADAAP